MAKFTTNDLTDVECFALVYVQMLCAKSDAGRKKFQAQWREGQNRMDMEGVSARDRRQFLANGLAGLREKGIIECTRDGEGDLVPSVYHEELIAPATTRLITSDLN